jgi:hypothetical protein
MNVKIDKADNLDFTAYAYSSAGDQPKSIILLNKTHGDSAAPIGVTLVGVDPHGWQMMSLEQETSDLAAKTDVTLGGAPIAPDGSWSAHWTDVTAGQEFTVSVKPTTAMLLRRKAPEPPGNQR